MEFNAAMMPQHQAELMRSARVEYEETDRPPIAIAPTRFNFTMAQMWSRGRSELMMQRDEDRQWFLHYFGADNNPDNFKFAGITDVHEAAAKMREWLDERGLILPGELDED